MKKWISPDFHDHIRIDSDVFYKKLTRLALPIALQSFISSSLNLVDNLMVGSLGETELAAVGIGIQLFFIFWMVIFGFTGGCSTFTAQFWGNKNMTNIRKVIGFSLTVSFSAGLVFFLFATFFAREFVSFFTDDPAALDLAVDYIHIGSPVFLMLGITVSFETALRATQQPRIPLYISMVAFSTNTLLNYIFIFGKLGLPAMGVQGAAIATVIARAIEMLLVIWVVFGKKNIISGHVKEFFAWNKLLAVRIFKNAFPTTINEVSWGLGMTACNLAYAQAGITAFAAVRASLTIFDLFILFAFSLGDAALIILGEHLGKGERDYAIGASKKLVKVVLIIGVVSGTLLIFIGKPLLGFFDFSPEGFEFAYSILLVYALTMWVDLYSGVHIVGILRGGGDTRFAMFTELGTIWLIAVPLAFAGTLLWNLPIYMVILLVRLETVIKSIILTLRWMSCKWANTVIKGM